jgi:hypothetical protein
LARLIGDELILWIQNGKDPAIGKTTLASPWYIAPSRNENGSRSSRFG